MAAKAVLVRPNVTAAALCLVRGRLQTTSPSFFHRSATATRARHDVWSGRSLFTAKFHLPRSVHRRNLSVRATTDSDNPSASFESPLMQSMEHKIKEHLNAESVIVKDAYGDGRHVSIEVVSSAFEGQSAVNRQRMVYKAIWEELQDRVHAVDQMTTRTPAEVGQ
ncbi:Protein BOLA4- chloroplastic/mitochondrial [Striga hermonthica]|uniref:Protein BOLA4- chloroplastic/mitochondrial n=1 Tax=Striga hermonthica TaxID=68872 RepID=A0A9N7RKA0_STRHE|nr:Protein BOLA4- chloroplastic/mitochondrial [Striga hermonthica]